MGFSWHSLTSTQESPEIESLKPSLQSHLNDPSMLEQTPLAQAPMEQAPMEQTQMQQTMEQAQIEQAPLEQQPSNNPGPSSESDANKEKNPWAVASIYDFNYFCCPDCDHRTQDKQQFVVHAAFFHARVSLF